MSRPNTLTYKTKNWPTYNEALKRRGTLTIWFDPEMSWDADPTGKQGKQPVYSDPAIQTRLTMKILFGLRRYPERAAQAGIAILRELAAPPELP